MTDRDDDLGSYRPTRNDAPASRREQRPERQGQTARPESAFGQPRLTHPSPVVPPLAQPVTHAPAMPPKSAHGIANRPVPAPPRAAPNDLDDLIEQLPRVARTGPARPLERTGAPPVPPAPIYRRSLDDDFDDDFDDDDERRGMPRSIKIIGYGVLTASVLAAAGAVGLVIYAPVDLVRDRLIAEVKSRTGRDLVIGGKPQISFWPNVAVSVRDVTLSNPQGMAGAPLVTMPRLDATIQLWPLLSKQVVIDRLVLQAPRITLVTDAQGRRNWDFADAALSVPRRVQFAKAGPLKLEDLPEDLRDFATGATDANRAARANGADGFALGRIRIIDGHLFHIDERAKASDEFKAIDMTIDAGEAKGPLQAAGTFVWRGETVRLDTRVMPLQALASGTLAQATIALTSEIGQLTFSGTVSGGAAAKLDGAVTVKSPSIAKTAAWLGQPLAGDLVNGPLSLKAKVSASGKRAGISDTALQAPGLTLSGALTLDQSGVRPKLTGAMRVADLNIDALQRVRLLAAPPRPHVAMPQSVSKTANGAPKTIEDLLEVTPPKAQVRGFVSRDGWNEAPFDLSALGLLDIDARLAFGRLVSPTFNTSQGQVHAVVVGRSAKLIVEDLALHDGKARGTLSFDATHAKPVLTLTLAMDGVALGALLKDAGTDGLDGRAKLNINVTGMGQSERQIVDTLSGKADMAIPRGTFTGYDVGAMVRGLAQMKLPRAERDPNAKTEFTDLGASFTIAKGVADNRDFRVVTRDARAIGTGQIALGPRTIDFVVRPKVTAATETASGLGGPGINLSALDLPVRITGPLAQPNVTADFQSVLANPAKALEAIDPSTRKDVEDTVKGVLAGDEAAKAKARDALNKLFGR